MSNVCTPCTKAKPIPTCITNLTIGTITALNTAVCVYIKNLTTGRLLRFSATSTGSGLVIVDISSQDWMPGHDYELWVTLASAVNIEDRENVTVSGTAYTCFELSFEYVLDTAGDPISYASQTLKIA